MLKNVVSGFIGFVIGVVFLLAVCLVGNSSDLKANKNFSVKIQYEDFSKVLYVVTDNETGFEYIVFKAGDGTAITPRLK